MGLILENALKIGGLIVWLPRSCDTFLPDVPVLMAYQPSIDLPLHRKIQGSARNTNIGTVSAIEI